MKGSVTLRPGIQLFPTTPNVGSIALRTLYSSSRSICLVSFLLFSLTEHLNFKTMPAIVASETNGLRHSQFPLA